MLQSRVPPPLLTAALGAAMGARRRRRTRRSLTDGARRRAFTFAGVRIPAIGAFRCARTTIYPIRIEQASALVTGGIFRLTRNPMYVALTLILVAWAILLGGPWVWAGTALLALWLDQLQIRPEERAIARRFGSAYAAYRSRVRRWL